MELLIQRFDAMKRGVDTADEVGQRVRIGADRLLEQPVERHRQVVDLVRWL